MKKVIPCEPNPIIREKILKFAEELRTQAHTIGTHGLSEHDFYESGLFDGTIERIRGQKSATMGPKKQFVSTVLNYMQDNGHIEEWEEASSANRHDLTITLNDGRLAVVELKGCLDGNNTNISDRPPHAEEFVTWSLCQNKTSDLQKGVWSGIHTRMGADIVDLEKRHDGLIVWDWICNSLARPCPKLQNKKIELNLFGSYSLPPPCLYAFPATVPSPRNNPKPALRSAKDVGILKAFYDCFGGNDEQLNIIEIEAKNDGANLKRKTTVIRDGKVVKSSRFTAIKRR